MYFQLPKKKVLHFEGYGKNFIKKYGASPDATAQLIKQLAFHRIFGRPGVTYESAQTRKYQLGRTEVIRTVSNESKAWVEEMIKPEALVRPLFLYIYNAWKFKLKSTPVLQILAFIIIHSCRKTTC